ncbi:MAG: FkbM family methyltransferase [Archangium sp.]
MLRQALIDTLRPFQFRGKSRLLQPLAPREGEYPAEVFGYRMRLDVSEFIQRQIYLGSFERQETGWVRRWLKPGSTFVDVGANVGYFTLLASSLVGSAGRVCACEPSVRAFQRLEATLRDNAISQARAFNFALGAEPGTLNLYFTSPTVTNHTPSMVAQEGARSVPVRVRTLDECLEEWGLERVDILKIDVEGFEPQVLAGAGKALATGRIRAILCEFNDHWLRSNGSSAAELYAWIRGHRYRDIGGDREPAKGSMENRFLVRAE